MTKSTIYSILIITSICFAPLSLLAVDDKPDIPKRTLYDFQDIKERHSWFPLNDDVVGGVSTGVFEFTDDNTLIFSGKLSLESRGGFASIRSKTDAVNLKGVKKIKLRVKGDGKSYYFNISSSNFVADPGFQAKFETKKGIWQEIVLPVDNFGPAFGSKYGREHLEMEEVRLMGVIISDKQAGAFKLEIDWIKAY